MLISPSFLIQVMLVYHIPLGSSVPHLYSGVCAFTHTHTHTHTHNTATYVNSGLWFSLVGKLISIDIP